MLSLGATIVFSAMSSAQGDIRQQPVSLEFQNTEIREVLKTAFKALNGSYSIAPDVQGRVTISTKDKNFEIVLYNVLSQVNATYNYEGGVIVIMPRAEKPLSHAMPEPQKPVSKRRIWIGSDATLIRVLLGQDYLPQCESTWLIRVPKHSFGGGLFSGLPI